MGTTPKYLYRVHKGQTPNQTQLEVFYQPDVTSEDDSSGDENQAYEENTENNIQMQKMQHYPVDSSQSQVPGTEDQCPEQEPLQNGSSESGGVLNAYPAGNNNMDMTNDNTSNAGHSNSGFGDDADFSNNVARQKTDDENDVVLSYSGSPRKVYVYDFTVVD